jgi:hypothetical protein
MAYSDKIVTSIPIEVIWNENDEIPLSREKYLTRHDIKTLLKTSNPQFVVANVGSKLKWIDLSQRYDFWKSEAEKHIADNINEIELDSFPDKYAYVASQWTGENMTPLILLETFH